MSLTLSCDNMHPKEPCLCGRASRTLSRLSQLFVPTCLTNRGTKQPIRQRTASSVMTWLGEDVSASFGWCGAHSSALLRRLWLHRAAQTHTDAHTGMTRWEHQTSFCLDRLVTLGHFRLTLVQIKSNHGYCIKMRNTPCWLENMTLNSHVQS